MTQIAFVALVLAVAEVEGVEQLAVLVVRGDDLHLVAHLGAEQLQDVVGHRLGGGDHLAEVEQRLHHRGRVGIDLVGEVGQRGAAGQPDRRAVAARQRDAADRRGLHVVEFLTALLLGLATLAGRSALAPEGAGSTTATTTATTGAGTAATGTTGRTAGTAAVTTATCTGSSGTGTAGTAAVTTATAPGATTRAGTTAGSRPTAGGTGTRSATRSTGTSRTAGTGTGAGGTCSGGSTGTTGRRPRHTGNATGTRRRTALLGSERVVAHPRRAGRTWYPTGRAGRAGRRSLRVGAGRGAWS